MRHPLEELHGLSDGHFEDIMNGTASIAYLEGILLVSATCAILAG
jgi:hypothetical protein